MNTIYYIAKADFLQRIRSYSFLITMGVCIWCSYTFIPPKGADYVTMSVNDYSFFYNSAAIGMIMSIITGMMLSLFGFYLINNSVYRDFHTGVGQILATTGMTKFQYLLGKWLSNFGVLASILTAAFLTSILLFFVKGETNEFDFIALLLPFLLICLPTMAFIASLAILAEVFVKISRGLVNVLYFVFWMTILINSISDMKKNPDKNEMLVAASDFLGFNIIFLDVERIMKAQGKMKHGQEGSWHIGSSIPKKNEKGEVDKFYWEGYRWGIETIIGRSFWFFVAIGLVWIASLLFRRFDTGGISYLMNLRNKKKKDIIPDAEEPRPYIPFAQLPKATIHFDSIALSKAELKIILWGQYKGWWLILLGLMIASTFSPLQVAHQILLPITYIWLLLVYSKMGSREEVYGTSDYLFSAASPLSRQLPAQLMAGMIVSFFISLPVLIRQLIALDLIAVAGILSATLFVPSTAFCVGIWTGGGKLFEVFFVILFDMLLNNVEIADFVGAGLLAKEHKVWLYYLLIALIAVLLSWVGRKKQLYR